MSFDQVIQKRGRRVEPEADPSLLPNDTDISWGAAWFQSAGFLDRRPKDVVNRMPLSFEFFIRLPRLDIESDVLQRFLDLFGGAIRSTTVSSRHQWICSGQRARNLIELWYPYFSSSMKTAASDALARDLIAASPSSTSAPLAAPSIHSARHLEPQIAVPKIHIVVPLGYDPDIMFLYVEDVQPGEPFVYGLPDRPTLERFVLDATSRSYIVLSTIELTVSLTRPPDY
jgi:hypothetical protein